MSTYECKLCAYTSPRNMNLQRHLRSRLHQKNLEQASSMKRFTMGGPYNPKVGFYCEMCDFRAHSLDDIQWHICPRGHRARFQEWLDGEYDRVVEECVRDCIDFYEIRINEYGQVTIMTEG